MVLSLGHLVKQIVGSSKYGAGVKFPGMVDGKARLIGNIQMPILARTRIGRV